MREILFRGKSLDNGDYGTWDYDLTELLPNGNIFDNPELIES